MVQDKQKTYLLQELFGNTFANILRIDFLENPAYKEAFDGSCHLTS